MSCRVCAHPSLPFLHRILNSRNHHLSSVVTPTFNKVLLIAPSLSRRCFCWTRSTFVCHRLAIVSLLAHSVPPLRHCSEWVNAPSQWIIIFLLFLFGLFIFWFMFLWNWLNCIVTQPFMHHLAKTYAFLLQNVNMLFQRIRKHILLLQNLPYNRGVLLCLDLLNH